MPSDRDIEFVIDLVHGTAPIYKRPYRMAAKQPKLKDQIKELLEKGYIDPSLSPWGAPMIFISEKDDTQRMCMDYCALNEVTVGVFYTSKNRVVRITHSSSEVVLRTTKNTMIYPDSGPSLEVIALHSVV
jgi:hypothetical protein